jgi:hypothetical protein
MHPSRFVLLIAVASLCAMPPRAKADEWNQKTDVTFSGPVEIPGRVLPAGTYVFKLADSLADRDIVQVFNKDENHLYGTFLAIPDYHLKPTSKTVITFEERASNAPEAVKAWFYPGDTYGHEFVYPRKRAMELAKLHKQAVPSMPDEMAAEIKKPAKTMKEASVTALAKAPLKAEQPTGEEVTVTAVFEAPPASARRSK